MNDIEKVAEPFQQLVIDKFNQTSVMTNKNSWRNLLQELSHQELWKYCAIAKDNSVWQIVALNEAKTKIHAKWLSGKTKIGQLDLEGKRISALTLDYIANIEEEVF